MEASTLERTVKTINNQEVSISEFDQFIAEQIDSTNVAGLSLALIQDSQVYYSRGYGYENIETRQEVLNSTVFEAASISKPVFTYFVMKQVEKGLLDIDTPVYKYLPKKEILNDQRHKLITTRMLLSHTSGLVNWRSQEQDKKLRILFQPNTKYHYSGEGYQYLKDIMCHLLQVDDEGLEALFLKEVAYPVGATQMNYLWSGTFESRKAFGHINNTPTVNEFRNEPSTGKFGAAYNLHVNAESYARFLVHLMNMDQGSNKYITEMFRPQFEMPHEDNEFPRSIAFPIKAVNNKLRYFHSGNNGDFRSYFHFYKEEGIGIVMLSNSDNFLESKFAQRVVEFLGDVWFHVI